MRYLIFLAGFLLGKVAYGQDKSRETVEKDTTSSTTPVKAKAKVMFGVASYYADKFNGRKTANGEIYDSKKMTAACNTLPLGTWIRVTNLSNNRSVIVKTNDRLHPKMTRLVDLSRAAAEKLGFIKKGITRVKVEVIEKKK